METFNQSSKNRIKKFFNYVLNFEINADEKFSYLFDKNSKKK